MDFFWSNVFEYFKDRRVAAVFFSALLVFAGLLLVGAIVCQTIGVENLRAGLVYAAPIMGILLLVWIWRSVAQARARRRDRYKISPMSCDELRKARSRLTSVRR